MDISEERAEALFGDDRERGLDAIREHHMSITQQKSGIVVEVDDDEFELTGRETENLLDDVGVESVWWLLSEKDKVLEHLRK